MLRDFLVSRALKDGSASIINDVADWADDELLDTAGDMSSDAVDAELSAALATLESFIVIRAIRIIVGSGADKVLLVTTLPSATPVMDSESLSLHFAAAAGTGADYCRRHFPGVEIEEIHVR